jgi:hypothetical protein
MGRTDNPPPGADLPKTDVQPANDSGFLAINHLLSLYHRTRDEIHAVRAIVALRYIAQRSPSELRAQFLLVRLCRLVGAYARFLCGYMISLFLLYTRWMSSR